MFSLLLAIIYLAFISLGLPDSLLGSAWPVISEEFSSPISYAGIVSMIISIGTIISSLLSDKITKNIGAGLITAISVGMTAVALLGFSFANSFIWLCILAVPYGLGAGGVDAALNNYVALHYKARHMNWLHSFWGVGVTISPYIMSFAIGSVNGWRMGYRIVSIIQMTLTFILFATLPLWKGKKVNQLSAEDNAQANKPLKSVLQMPGVKAILFAFFGYCALETTTGLWATSYLVEYKNINEELAASLASLFYLGITVGRFISGFIADKLGDKNMIRIGASIIIIGLLLIAIPFDSVYFAFAGLILAGLGAAPVYPAIIHSTPENFGKENSQAIVGIQMASAYTGSTFTPLIFGAIARRINISLYPFFLLIFGLLVLIMTEVVNCQKKNKIISN